MDNIVLTNKNNNMKTSWNEVTYEDYLKIASLNEQSEMSDIEKSLNLLSILSGFTYRQVNDLPLTTLKEKMKQMVFMSESMPDILPVGEYDINGKLFKVDYSFQNITAGEHIDFVNAVQDLTPYNMAIIMSLIFKPAKRVKSIFGKDKLEVIKYDRDELIEFLQKNLPYYIVHKVQLFFSKVMKKLYINLRISLDIQIKKLKITQMVYKMLGKKLKAKIIGDGLDVLIEYQKNLDYLGMKFMI